MKMLGNAKTPNGRYIRAMNKTGRYVLFFEDNGGGRIVRAPHNSTDTDRAKAALAIAKINRRLKQESE